ncbi:MAG: hypothetical protein ACI91B_000601, partial [Planctomycetota bacterium]
EDAVVALPPSEIVAASKPVPVAPMPERAPEKPLSASQEKMVRELQDRVAKAGPGNSLITQIQHREMRTKRKQHAARKVVDQLTATCVVGELPPQPEPVLELSKKCEVDPRQLEGWFQELPEPEQARLRQMWFDVRHKFDDSGQIYRTRLKRAIGYGALAFFCMAVLMVGLAGGFMLVPGMTIAGAIAGAAAHLFGGGRFVYAGCGLIAYLSVVAPFFGRNPFLLYGALLSAFVMGAIGMDGEMRRSAGYSKD